VFKTPGFNQKEYFIMERIKKNDEFQKMYSENNKKLFSHYSVVYLKKNNFEVSRFGIVVSKKNGNAVVRNRIKRLFKEMIRKNLSDIKKGYDVIIISKRQTGENIKEIKYENIEKDLKKTFLKAGMII
jgi:ribonuclease P protein component